MSLGVGPDLFTVLREDGCPWHTRVCPSDDTRNVSSAVVCPHRRSPVLTACGAHLRCCLTTRPSQHRSRLSAAAPPTQGSGAHAKTLSLLEVRFYPMSSIHITACPIGVLFSLASILGQQLFAGLVQLRDCPWAA